MRQTKNLWLVVALIVVAGSVLAQRTPVDEGERQLRPHVQLQKISATVGPLGSFQAFHLNNVRYTASIDAQAIAKSPDWKPGQPLPVEFPKLEVVAREELRKFQQDDSEWEVIGFHMKVFHASDWQKW